MRERVKTGLLLLLVGISIILTGRLLFGQPALETALPPAYERLTFGELRPPTEQLVPRLRLGAEDAWWVLEPWDEGQSTAWALLLELIHAGKPPEGAAPPHKMTGTAAHAFFAMPVQARLWLSASLPAELRVAEVAWFAQEPLKIWFKDHQGSWLTSELSLLPDGWEEQFMNAFAGGVRHRLWSAAEWEPLVVDGEDKILIPEDLPYLAPFSIRSEMLDTEKLLRSIFINQAMVRRIEERDGAVIYTDGQRGLRLFPSGQIGYTSPKSEPGQEAMELGQALRRAAQYLQFMGGWPVHLWVDPFSAAQNLPGSHLQGQVETISLVSVQEGMRLLAAEPAVKLLFSDRGVIDYKRQIVLLDSPLGTERALIDPRQAVQSVAEYLKAETTVGRLIQVYPAYYVGHGTAQPAWVFLFKHGQTVFVQGHTGQILASN
ncbi:MAG: hypothetical protein KGZ44_07625 [Dethiobacter sp.]|nr:hypothetical protein [Dethiobacter sp.]